MPSTDEHHLPVGEPVPGWTARALPRPGPFHGRFCSVVPLSVEHADALYPTCAAPGTEHLWTYLSDGPYPDQGAFRARLERTVADPDGIAVAVTDPAGTPAGLANYLRLDPGNGSVEVGGILLGTTLRRTPAATEAMHLMAAHVFEDLGYRRYEWKCDALNAASVAAALRLGFRYEGTFRHALVYKGRNRDTAWFSITDSEWDDVAAAHRAWLHPDNFDDDGRQRSPLRRFLPSHQQTVPSIP